MHAPNHPLLPPSDQRGAALVLDGRDGLVVARPLQQLQDADLVHDAQAQRAALLHGLGVAQGRRVQWGGAEGGWCLRGSLSIDLPQACDRARRTHTHPGFTYHKIA